MRNSEQMRARRTFLLVNAIALFLVLVVYPLLIWASKHLIGSSVSCVLHDVCRVYCPACGATRATWALIHGQLFTALQYNAAIVLIYAALFVIDLRAFIILLRGGTKPFRLHPAVWWSLGSLLVAYAVVRNVALLAFGVDWVGDFI